MSGAGGRGANRHFETSRAFQHMDLDAIAQQTGGKAYYNTNGLKEVIAEIVANGSNYYTLAYSTTNQKWEGQFRHIKLKLSRAGLHVQYRQGYYAIDRSKQEQRLLAAMQKKKAAAANNPFQRRGCGARGTLCWGRGGFGSGCRDRGADFASQGRL